MDEIITKEQFLSEHNRLSPQNLQTTLAVLTRFQEEKKPLLKDSDWSFKLRIPFIVWLGSLPVEKVRQTRKADVKGYNIYPKPE